MQNHLYEDLYILEDYHWWHISKRRIIQNLIEKYNRIEHPKILDIGCGTGKNIESILGYGRVWGLDNSPTAIKFCKMRGLKNLRLGSADKTNFKSGSFNIVTMLDVLEHTDDKKTLKEMRRIIKEDGLLIATVPAFSWLWSEWDNVLHHKRRYNKNDLIEILRNNNFKVVRATYLYSFLVLPIFLIRKIKRKLFYKQEYPSDFRLNHPLLNNIMNLLARLEFIISEKIKIPFGTSILVIGKKYGH